MFSDCNCRLGDWVVFGPLDVLERVPVASGIPNKLEVNGRIVPAQCIERTADVLDLEPLIGGKGDDRGGLVYLPVTVKKTGKYTLGCGADYWMEVFLDGISVIDRSQSGTRKVPPRPDDFLVDLELTEGKHVLGIRMTSGTSSAAICAALGDREALLAYAAQIHRMELEENSVIADFAQSQGRVRSLHGVTNGPKKIGALVDVTAAYRELDLPWIRLHDSGGTFTCVVDIPAIFPNEDADPENPENYRFGKTDEYLERVVATGAEVIYRLGVSIEHSAKKYHARPPKDFSRWAQVCIGIIRHYNQGWADGFHYHFLYWEIWNEPHGNLMWCDGTDEMYFELYRTAATAIKQFDPHLKVGGPAIYSPDLHVFNKPFLAFCRDRRVPLDFFSWHLYCGLHKGPEKMLQKTVEIRKLLDSYGFAATENHLTEWNRGPDMFCESAELRRDDFATLRNEHGAAYCVSALIGFQDTPLDVAAYYDGQPCSTFCGLFDGYGIRQKTWYGFQAVNFMTKFPTRVRAIGKNNIYVLAAYDSGEAEAAVLLAKCGGDRYLKSPLLVKNLPPECNEYELLCLDHDHNFEVVEVGPVPADGTFMLSYREYAVFLLRFRHAENCYNQLLRHGNAPLRGTNVKNHH